MKNNTVPTVITDVNGKITTVHKKIDGKANATRKIPAPVQPGVTKRATEGTPVEAEREGPDVRVWLDKNNPDMSAARAKKQLAQIMEKNKGRTQMGLEKHFLIHAMSKEQVHAMIDGYGKEGFADVANGATSTSNTKRPGKDMLASMALVYEEELFSEYPANVKPTRARVAYHKLRQYQSALFDAGRTPEVGWDHDKTHDLSTHPEETIEKVRNYVRLWEAANNADKDTSYRTMRGLAEIALNGENDPNDVVEIIREHGVLEPNVISGMLNGTKPALAEGWL